jgi:hypothetical protein
MPEPAFREHASGLIVPAELSRTQTKHSKDDWRRLERAAKFVDSIGLQMFLRCGACKQPLERIRTAEGGIAFQCQCSLRIFTGAL